MLERLFAWHAARLAAADEAGQGTVEYALVIGVGVVLAITALTVSAPNIQNIISASISAAMGLIGGVVAGVVAASQPETPQRRRTDATSARRSRRTAGAG